MSFQPKINQELAVDGLTYHIVEHPAAPGMPYGQEGRAAVVYQLLAPPASGESRGENARALKVFKPRYRTPSLVTVAGRLVTFASLPGLQVCRRSVLAPQHHGALLRQHPDLTYAVLMPWVEGPTWMEVMLEKHAFTPAESLTIAQSLVKVLVGVEQRGLAHCDLSASNVMLPLLAGGTGVALVDVEGMYGPGLERPREILSGSPGYAHKTAPEGLWGPEADRFGGAVLVAEMLGWCDGQVREASWGENYFDPYEMQRESERYDLLVNSLRKRWGTEVAALFERTWHSESLVDCPTFGEWLVVLPEEVPEQASEEALSQPIEAPTGDAVRALLTAAQRLEEQGNIAGALEVYRQARALAPAMSGAAQELELVVRDLEAKQVVSSVEKQVAEDIAREEVLPSIQTGSEAELDALFDAGLAAYERGEWAKAQELLGEVVLQRPAYARRGKRATKLLAEVEKQGTKPRRRRVPNWIWPIGGTLALAIFLGVAFLVGLTYMGTKRWRQPSLGDTRTRPADGMVMVYVPGGEFLMGGVEGDEYVNPDEYPQHLVVLSDFWIDQTEVTNAQYASCVAVGSCSLPADASSSNRSSYYGHSAYADYPVIHVSWQQGEEYCSWVGGQLPTEAQWEYAAQGPEGSIYPWGNSAPNCSRANHSGCVGDTTAVGSYPVGESWCKAQDLGGNVWEWTADWYDLYSAEQQVNPSGPSSGSFRVLRGGSWSYRYPATRATNRMAVDPNHPSESWGFRCVVLSIE
jgi:formylglycine-generating enzyme required for sulfatase activity